ncbi:hypothetical protein VPHD479_0354 [Vibrio phage D479]
MYQVGKIKQRLNKQGRSLYAGKLFLGGLTYPQIAETLDVSVERIPTLLGNAAGLLGLYDKFEEGTSGASCMMQSFARAPMYITQIDIIIASKGDRLFTNDPIPKKKVKEC